MKLEFPKEWFQRSAEIEGDSEVGAGTPPWTAVQNPVASTEAFAIGARLAFGNFVSLWRRNKGWDPQRLAAAAGIDVEEVLEIEHHLEPEPDAVYKLASVLKVDPKALLEIAGLRSGQSPKLREKATLFAAHSESMAQLLPHEREALEAFADTLAKYPNP